MAALRKIPEAAAVPLLVALFLVAGFVSLRRESATFDETAHLAAGFTALDRLDFRHNPEHPPLAKMWGALPVWVGGLRSPDYGSPDWNGMHLPAGDPQRSRANQWTFGFEFLNGPLDRTERLDPGTVLVPARTMMLLLGALLGLVVWAWARDLWGRGSALLALLVYVLSPPILAHARLVTTDIAAALGFTAALWLLRRFLARPTAARAVLVGLALGGALLAKFSTLLLIPISALLAAWWILREGGNRRRILTGLAGAAAVSYVVLWAGYGFRFAAASDPGYRLEWEAVAPGSGVGADLALFARDHRLAPEAYLYGFGLASRFSKARLAYFHGEQRFTGWWYWFPAAFFLKTPLAFLGLAGWAAADGWRRARRIGFEAACLAVPLVLYFGTSMASRLNIGHRHLLPVYPLLCVGAGGAATFLASRGWRRIAAIGLLAGCGFSFAAATPGYLAYFNVLAGGARGGGRWLVDSNLDWGQDLPALARLLRDRGIARVDLAYFGTADPRAYGIEYRKVLMVHDFHPADPPVRPAPGDWLAVSETLLRGVYVDRDGDLATQLLHRGLVSPSTTRAYLSARDAAVARGERFPSFYDWVVETGAVDAARRDEALTGSPAALFERALATWIPAGRAGDSIVLYRVPS